MFHMVEINRQEDYLKFKELRRKFLGSMFRLSRERVEPDALRLAGEAGITPDDFHTLVAKRIFYSQDDSFEIEEIRGSRGMRYSLVSFMPTSYGDT